MIAGEHIGAVHHISEEDRILTELAVSSLLFRFFFFSCCSARDEEGKHEAKHQPSKKKSKH